MGGKTADTRYKLQIILIITIQYIYDHDTLMTVTSLIVQRDRNVPTGTHHYTQVCVCVYGVYLPCSAGAPPATPQTIIKRSFRRRRTCKKIERKLSKQNYLCNVIILINNYLLRTEHIQSKAKQLKEDIIHQPL